MWEIALSNADSLDCFLSILFPYYPLFQLLKKMSAQRIKQFRDVYEKFCQVPLPLSARVLSVTNGNVQIESIWSSRVPTLKKSLRTSKFSTLSYENLSPISTHSSGYSTTEWVCRNNIF